jgi:hypothetical protein
VTPAELRRLAEARATALAVDLTATAAGIWEPTPDLLDALSDLAWTTVWDLAVVA